MRENIRVPKRSILRGVRKFEGANIKRIKIEQCFLLLLFEKLRNGTYFAKASKKIRKNAKMKCHTIFYLEFHSSRFLSDFFVKKLTGVA